LLRPRRLVEECGGGKRESCHEEAKFLSHRGDGFVGPHREWLLLLLVMA
jgi:hypothetical protein